MDVGEHVHWYLTTRCNLNCSYCFKPDSRQTEEVGRIEALARILADNGVKRVTFGGGEPLLVSALDRAAGILKENGAYISIHTNGMLLDDKRIASLAGLADDIALPIDSMDERVQRLLRGERFIPTHRQMLDKAAAITDNGMALGYHTVFTSANRQDIPELYEALRQTDFQYWRIYEFNENLARMRILRAPEPKDEAGRMRLFRRLRKIERLAMHGTPGKGYTDCLQTYFILAEEEIRRHRDQRVQFVGIRDGKTPYAFLENSGEITYYTWFSCDERRSAGNILTDGFSSVMQRLREVEEKGWELDEDSEKDFNEATFGDVPLWARIHDGTFSYDELDEIRPSAFRDFNHLLRLHMKREARVERGRGINADRS
jgi:MoaA/NifB/PqqE/SkfB family radical SAM enzyme